jgi:chemotaxis protein CheX
MTQIVSESPQSAFSESMMNADYLDGAVAEVLQIMLGSSFSLATRGVLTGSGAKMVTAVVGLAGSISGACVLCTEDQAAMQMTSSMVGIEIDTLDDTVKDAMGEVCNMLAGAWKGRIPALASQCLLSVPTVVTGSDYLVHVHKPTFLMERNYNFRDRVFSVRIQGDPVAIP